MKLSTKLLLQLNAFEKSVLFWVRSKQTNGGQRLRLMMLAKKVRGTVKADRESKEFEFVTEEIIEEGIVDQISR
ncbi:hypothetical protein Tco_0281208 [Tanacetum coccineum]